MLKNRAYLLFILCIFREIRSIEFVKRFVLKANTYLEIQNSFIKDPEINFSSGDIKGSFEVSVLQVPSSGSNAVSNSPNGNTTSIDIFIFSDEDNINDTLCYKKAIINGNFSSNCPFLKDKKKKMLNQSNFNSGLFNGNSDLQSIPTFKTTYFIDNTKFPNNGSFNGDDLLIQTVYSVSVEPSNSYFLRTVVVAVVLAVVLIIFIMAVFYLMIKYKEVKKKYREEILNLNPNDRSFVTGPSGKKRVGSRDRNESFEESKIENSSLNNSFNRRLV